MATTLKKLLQYLDGLHDRAPLEELVRHLKELKIDCAEVTEFIRFANQTYARNLVRAGPWYHLLVLCWKNGQRSPIHNHAGSTCGVRVLRGIATETQFEFAPNGHVKALCSRDLQAGQVCGSQDDDMHQISNLQAGSADLVTLHIYTPPLKRMETYSLASLERGEELMFPEFSSAAGI
jgi:cysteine dioxygenase